MQTSHLYYSKYADLLSLAPDDNAKKFSIFFINCRKKLLFYLSDFITNAISGSVELNNYDSS